MRVESPDTLNMITFQFSFDSMTSTRQYDRNQASTIWVGNLEESVNEELLWELFLQVGPVVDVHMPLDKITGQSNNYAFVEFENEVDADYAMKVLNMVKLNGKSLRINRAAREKESLDVGANLFVGNLSREVDDQVRFRFATTNNC